VLENGVLRTIFGHDRKVENLCNEELHNLHSYPVIVSVIKIKQGEMGSTCSTHGSKEI
jgi:hypothetical protein